MSAREWTLTREVQLVDRVVAEAIEEAEVVMVATEAEEEVVVVAEEDKEVVLAKTTEMVRATIEETKTVTIREAHQETMIVQIDKEEIETTEVHQEEEETTTKDPEEMRVKGMASLPEVVKEREATDKPSMMVRDQEEEALETEVDKEEEAVQEEEEMIEVDMTTEVHQESLENHSTQRKPETNFQRSELIRGRLHVDHFLIESSIFALSSTR